MSERIDVVGHEAAGVPDDVRVAGPQPECLLDVQPCVHAGDDRRDPDSGRRGQRGPVERFRVALVLAQQPRVLRWPLSAHGLRSRAAPRPPP